MLVMNSSKRFCRPNKTHTCGLGRFAVSLSLLQQDGVMGRIMGPRRRPCPNPPGPEDMLPYMTKGTLYCDYITDLEMGRCSWIIRLGGLYK